MTNKTLDPSTFLIGAHMSISDGFSEALIQGQSIGCTCIQIFTKSNRQWHAKALSEKDVLLFKKAWAASTIKDVIVHSSYLINIGSPNEDIAQKSTAALIEELNRCAQLGVSYLVLHPGARLESPENVCLQQIAKNLDIALEATPITTTVLLETMAGQGSTIGGTFKQLATIRAQSHHKKRIGYCVDTCHIFAAGYEFTSKKGYDALWEKFDTVLGLEHLKAIHVNDSKSERGSNVDRHEGIGKGKIGIDAFRLLVNDPRFFGTIKIIETPKGSLDDDKENIETLRSLLTSETKKVLHI